MGYREHPFDKWTAPLIVAWTLFFVSGLFPGVTFDALREAGWVTTQRAMVNSPHLVTGAYAFYLAHFALRRAQEGGAPRWAARLTGFYVFVLGLIAFFELPFRLVIFAPSLLRAGDGYILLMVGVVKLIAWLVLYGMVLRYYAMGNTKVFAELAPQRPITADRGSKPKQDVEETAFGEDAAGR